MHAPIRRSFLPTALAAFFVLMTLLAGCAVPPPSSIVQQPMTVRQAAVVTPPGAKGAIFQAANHRPLFEDRRARQVGDTLTILITERTSAGKQSSNAISKSSQINFGVPKLFGLSTSLLNNLGVNTASSSNSEDEGNAASSNNFSSTITVTVADVLPNGYLSVVGEKQIALDRGVEYVRFSGVVRPESITAGNVVPSTQVADARVEYRTDSRVDTAAVVSSLARFFLSVLPF